MSVHDFPSKFASITEDEVTELMESRLAGEDDLHFAARLTRIACSRWLLSSSHTKNARLNGANSETVRKYEIQERRAHHTMTTYTQLLNEALTAKVA